MDMPDKLVEFDIFPQYQMGNIIAYFSLFTNKNNTEIFCSTS